MFNSIDDGGNGRNRNMLNTTQTGTNNKNKEYEITTTHNTRDGRRVVKVERHPDRIDQGQQSNRTLKLLSHVRNMS